MVKGFFTVFIACSVSFAQNDPMKPQRIYKSESLVIEKHIETPSGFVVLRTYNANQPKPTCVIKYPYELGAKLSDIALAVALICHKNLPSVEARVFGVEHYIQNIRRILEGKEDFEVRSLAQALNSLFLNYGLETPKPLEIIFKSPFMGTCAYYPTSLSICCNADFWTQSKNQRGWKQVFAHEMVHAAMVRLGRPQDYNQQNSWLYEALADLIAFKHGFISEEVKPGCKGFNRHYTPGYRCGAALLGFSERVYGLDLYAVAQGLRTKNLTDPEAFIMSHLDARKKDAPSSFEALWQSCLNEPNDPYNQKFGCEGGYLSLGKKIRFIPQPVNPSYTCP